MLMIRAHIKNLENINNNKTMTLGGFLNVIDGNYPKYMPLEHVLADLMFKRKLDVNTILASHASALEKERHLLNSRFNEAVINLTQILDDKFTNKEDVYKRAIHTFNLNKTLVPHIHDAQYGYTEEDEKKWDDFCESTYGTNLKD